METGPVIVTPYLSVPDAGAAIAFYGAAFGAVEQLRLPAEDGKRTLHAELDVAGARVFLSDMQPVAPAGVAIALGLARPADVDATAQRMARAGATIRNGPMDAFWGDRFAEVVDPFGHCWLLTAALAGSAADASAGR